MAHLILSPISDAYVSQGSSTANFGSSNSLYTGEVDASHQYKFYIKFDLSKIPSGATNITASMKMFLYRKDNTGGPDTITVQRITGKDFIESIVNYSTTVASTALTSGDTGSLAVATTDLSNFISITLDHTVSEWFAGTNPNYGLVISGPATPAAILGFYSRHNSDLSILPYIDVSYTVNYAPVYTVTAQTAQNILPTEAGAPSTGISAGNLNGTTYVVTNNVTKECTAQLQCSNDNTTYISVGAPITLPANVPVEISANIPMSYIRLMLTGTGFSTGDEATVQAYTRQ